MKGFVFLSTLFASVALLGASVVVTNELLTVDQNNVPSVTNVLGTVSDLARLQAQTELNAAAASVAEDTYDQATNLLDTVASEIAAERTVVYRKYFLDSFTAAVVVDPAVDKVGIYGWEKLPNEQQTEDGRAKWYMYYGCTVDIGSITPVVKSASDLSSGLSGFVPLDSQYVTDLTPMSGTWTDAQGNTYEHLYRITVSIPEEKSHFCIIYISGDVSEGSGDTLTVVGGFTGGVTTNFVSGNLTIQITGGLCTGVTDANGD